MLQNFYSEEAVRRFIDVATGHFPADLVLKNCLVVNVFSGEIIKNNVALIDGIIAGVGDNFAGREEINLNGRYLIPGLIDGHCHIESSMLVPAQFAAAVLPHGTTAVIADPHEIVNVAGLEGLSFMVEISRGLPVDFFYMIPSCVPSTHMETSGASIGSDEIKEAFRLYPQSPGLAEMMNFPGFYRKVTDILKKIQVASEEKRLVDGHAPMLSGKNLAAYIGAGILTDHECTSTEEALEKIRLGMKIIIREGSAAKNLLELLPVVNEWTYPEIFFCSDDRHPGDLISEGGIDYILRKAVAAGLNPVTAIRMATINPARHYKLTGYGAVAPGYRADLVVVDNLNDFTVEMVFKSALLAALDGKMLSGCMPGGSEKMKKTVFLPDLGSRLEFKEFPPDSLARVIKVFPEQIITEQLLVQAARIDFGKGFSRVAVIERHGKNGNIALGLVYGFGSLNGALASTVAHDSHNLILVGTDQHDIELAAITTAEMGGGLVVVSGGRVIAGMPLPVGGLMSEGDVYETAKQQEEVNLAAKKIGCVLPSPFMTMSFLALPVIPELRITDRGLVDVNRFELVGPVAGKVKCG